MIKAVEFIELRAIMTPNREVEPMTTETDYTNKYHAQPISIEAIQFTGTPASFDQIVLWLDSSLGAHLLNIKLESAYLYKSHPQESMDKIGVGDYVVRLGDSYRVMDKDQFESIFEKMDGPFMEHLKKLMDGWFAKPNSSSAEPQP